jgi:enolase-phosphatase E1
MIKAIVTDIEGTTSSLAFVQEVLFPYAAERLPDFVRSHGEAPEVAAALQEARRLLEGPSDLDALIARMLEWIADDRKITPLKTIQGLIWADGYASGHLQGHLYPDVAGCLRRWARGGIRLYVYSSGSVQAQRLLFGHTAEGDLTGLFSGFFDTQMGGKREISSYLAIADAIRSAHPGIAPSDILFLSDILEELDAARAAGFKTTALQRGAESDPVGSHPVARDFETIALP